MRARGTGKPTWAWLVMAALPLPLQSTHAQETVRQGFELQVPISPAALPAAGETHLVYELHLSSFASKPLQLTRVTVADEMSGTLIESLDGAELHQRLGMVGDRDGVSGASVIPPGRRAVVYLHLRIQGSSPGRLVHRVEFRTAGSDDETLAAVTGGRAVVDDRRLPVLAPPLRGGPWVAVFDRSMERGHRRVIYAVDGRARIPGRFAIDWMKPRTRSEGSAAPQPSGHGADVLAVADAVVVDTRDGIADHWPANNPAAVELADAAGNYVVLELGDGRYAAYEHLLPGLLVRPGDRVRTGQVIGKVGATGQASSPHLHFHVGDSAGPLTTEGLPYLLSGVTVLGTYPSISAFSNGEAWEVAENPNERTPSFPGPNVVVRFPGGPVD